MAVNARDFGPNQDARRAVGTARAANSAASLFGTGVPGAHEALGLANIFLSPPNRRGGEAVKFAISESPRLGQLAAHLSGTAAPIATTTATTAADLAAAGVPGALSGFASGALNALAGGAFSLFAGGGPLQFLEPISQSDLRRRAERSRDALGLGGEIVRSLRSGRGLRSLTDPVGGSTVGDALEAMSRYNTEGTWYTDTEHSWLPEPSLVRVQRGLERLGFGRSEPTRGDVGGVGEIVAGSGGQLVPREFLEATDPSVTGHAGHYGTALGSLGWENVLRNLTREEGPSRVVMPIPPGTQPSMRETRGGAEYVERPGGGLDLVPTEPRIEWRDPGWESGLVPFYTGTDVQASPWEALHSPLETYYPEGFGDLEGDTVEKIKRAHQDRLETIQALAAAYSGAP